MAILWNGEWGMVFEAYAKDELGTDKDIQISAEDSREVRELKQIVNGSELSPLRMSDINAQLQSMDIYPLPLPDSLRSYQNTLDFDE